MCIRDSPLPLVALAADLPALEPREQLLDICSCDFLERQAQLGADLRQVPQHVAQLDVYKRQA